MFTGIIQKIGLVTDKIQGGLTIKGAFKGLKKGGSVAINGVCLTVVSKKADVFTVNVIHETLRVTTLGKLKIGDKVNLEAALRLNSLIEGHLVQGHVDAIGKITRITDDKVYTVDFCDEWNRYIVYKGSIAVDGVSLTVSKKGRKFFEASIIPYTFKNTIFHTYRIGDYVNLEFDIIGKYVYAQKTAL